MSSQRPYELFTADGVEIELDREQVLYHRCGSACVRICQAMTSEPTPPARGERGVRSVIRSPHEGLCDGRRPLTPPRNCRLGATIPSQCDMNVALGRELRRKKA
jgi:hypothetical protein